jgi:hypothetical protein
LCFDLSNEKAAILFNIELAKDGFGIIEPESIVYVGETDWGFCLAITDTPSANIETINGDFCADWTTSEPPLLRGAWDASDPITNAKRVLHWILLVDL